MTWAHQQTAWTPERVEEMCRLWKDGVSASQIAKQLGGCTRNGVLGKIHRMGLAERPAASPPNTRKDYIASPAKPRGPRAPRPLIVKLAGNATVFHEGQDPQPPRAVISFRDEPAGLATTTSLEAHQCKWPIGDPADATFTHCGRPAPGGPYCAEHEMVARAPPSKRRSDANDLARSLRRYL